MNVSIRQDISQLLEDTNSLHEDVMYSFSECEYKTGQKFNLRTRKLSKHECVKYLCDECKYNTRQKFHLITHKQSKHEGIKFSCVESSI